VYLGEAREVAGVKEEEFSLDRPATLEHAFSQALNMHPSLARIKRILKFLLNGDLATENTELKDGDRVTILSAIGGG